MLPPSVAKEYAIAMFGDDAADWLLDRLIDGHAVVLGDDLVGFYVFGSLVVGDFDATTSDVDTVVVLRDDLTSEQVDGLRELHTAIVRERPEWSDRVEAVYVSVDAMANFREGRHPAARISPGESFHTIEVDDRWLIDWYQLREVGETLTGPPPASVVPAISKSEWIDAVRRHVLDWPEPGPDLDRGRLAYGVLTLCRGLRTWEVGDHVSKRAAAQWAAERLPHHADVIGKALEWRTSPAQPIGGPVLDDARRFVAEAQRAL